MLVVIVYFVGYLLVATITRRAPKNCSGFQQWFALPFRICGQVPFDKSFHGTQVRCTVLADWNVPITS